jgi:hypothetical protein
VLFYIINSSKMKNQINYNLKWREYVFIFISVSKWRDLCKMRTICSIFPLGQSCEQSDLKSTVTHSYHPIRIADSCKKKIPLRILSSKEDLNFCTSSSQCHVKLCTERKFCI